MSRTGKMLNKIAIIGMAPTSCDLAPWEDPAWEKWVINESHEIPRLYDHKLEIDRWFQLHPYWDFSRQKGVCHTDHLDWLKQPHSFPIYMQKKYPSIPRSVAFPFEELFEWAPDILKNYWTCTFVYQVVFALWSWCDGRPYIERTRDWFETKTLGLWGIEMSSETEIKEAQKSALEAWIAYAAGLGVNIVLPNGCRLFKGPRYPRKYAYDQVPEVHRHHLELRIQKKTQEYNQLLKEVNELIDQTNETDDWYSKEYLDLKQEIKKKTQDIYVATGYIQAVENIRSEVDDTIYRFKNAAEDV